MTHSTNPDIVGLKMLALAAIGKVLATPPVRGLINLLAKPFGHLLDVDGSLYMGRWSVIREGSLASRVLFKLTGYASIRLHHICRADNGRELHNHPFRYRTFILKGWYAEQRPCPWAETAVMRIFHGAGDTATGTPHDLHRVSSVSPFGVWTLFFMSPNTGLWGFDVSGRFVPSDTYKKAGGMK